jgi:hypothetical protein
LVRTCPPVSDLSISAHVNSDSRETGDILDRSRLFFYQSRLPGQLFFNNP